jgi:hypothetical protein
VQHGHLRKPTESEDVSAEIEVRLGLPSNIELFPRLFIERHVKCNVSITTDSSGLVCSKTALVYLNPLPAPHLVVSVYLWRLDHAANCRASYL